MTGKRRRALLLEFYPVFSHHLEFQVEVWHLPGLVCAGLIAFNDRHQQIPDRGEIKVISALAEVVENSPVWITLGRIIVIAVAGGVWKERQPAGFVCHPGADTVLPVGRGQFVIGLYGGLQ